MSCRAKADQNHALRSPSSKSSRARAYRIAFSERLRSFVVACGVVAESITVVGSPNTLWAKASASPAEETERRTRPYSIRAPRCPGGQAPHCKFKCARQTRWHLPKCYLLAPCGCRRAHNLSSIYVRILKLVRKRGGLAWSKDDTSTNALSPLQTLERADYPEPQTMSPASRVSLIALVEASKGWYLRPH